MARLQVMFLQEHIMKKNGLKEYEWEAASHLFEQISVAVGKTEYVSR